MTAIGQDGSVTVVDRQEPEVRLPAHYVQRHAELGWAVTGYGNQGVTVDHGICVVEAASTRAGIYVGMTRGRDRNMAWVLDPAGFEDAAEMFAAAIARPPNACTAHAVREQLYRAAGVGRSEQAEPAPLPDDPARRTAERLDRLAVLPRTSPRLSR